MCFVLYLEGGPNTVSPVRGVDEWKHGGIEEDLKLGEPTDLRLERSQRSDYCHANNGICSGVTHMRITLATDAQTETRSSPR